LYDHAALFAVALLARGVAALLLAYSDWLLHVLREGVQSAWQVMAQFGDFLSCWRESLTQQIFGYRSTY
jgi:hypothetical protein